MNSENQKIFAGKTVAEIDEIIAAGRAERNNLTAFHLEDIKVGMTADEQARAQAEILRILRDGR